MSRLDWNSWFTGLVDGDGCFSYRKYYDPRRPFGKLMIQPYFHISLRSDDAAILEECRVRFGGTIRHTPARVRKTHVSKPITVWQVVRKNLLLRIVAHFNDYPPQTKKIEQYKIWRNMVEIYLSSTCYDKRLLDLSNMLSEQSKFNSTQIDLVPIENPQLSLIEFSETQRR